MMGDAIRATCLAKIISIFKYTTGLGSRKYVKKYTIETTIVSFNIKLSII
jgi:hypothetical protein